MTSVQAMTVVEGIYGLIVALIAAVPATAALWIGLKNKNTVDEIAPKVIAIDNAVNQKLTPESPTLRETAESTGVAVGVLKDQEAARIVERTEDKAERDAERDQGT